MPASTIVVVDDNYMVRQMARRALQRHGYTVLEAADGEEALELAATAEPPVRLVLSDVQMEPISGPELYARLRERHPDIRVLLMSGYPVEPLRLPPDVAVLSKPFTLAEIVAQVERALE